MNDLADLKEWESLKERCSKIDLTLVIDGSIIRIENSKTEGVYFQARNLREIDIYISGYCYGRRDEKLLPQK